MVSTFDAARIMDRIDMPSKIAVDTQRTLEGDARFAPRPLGLDILLGTAVDVRTAPATHYTVVATKLDRDWPGTSESVTFAVHRLALMPDGSYQARQSWGFFHERECWQFLTGHGEIQFSVFDLRGRETVETRQCLGVSEGMTDRLAVDLASDVSSMAHWLCPNCGAMDGNLGGACASCGAYLTDGFYDDLSAQILKLESTVIDLLRETRL